MFRSECAEVFALQINIQQKQIYCWNQQEYSGIHYLSALLSLSFLCVLEVGRLQAPKCL
jgi:hypothetical protein